jgi:hypothetical protein
MDPTTYSLIPHSSTYSDYKRARISEVDTTAGEIVHRWPSGAVNVRFPGLYDFPGLEITTTPANLIVNTLQGTSAQEKAA